MRDMERLKEERLIFIIDKVLMLIMKLRKICIDILYVIKDYIFWLLFFLNYVIIEVGRKFFMIKMI